MEQLITKLHESIQLHRKMLTHYKKEFELINNDLQIVKTAFNNIPVLPSTIIALNRSQERINELITDINEALK